MGIRFHKSIHLGHGARINLSKSGVGYSWGTKGMRFTKTAKGTTKSTFSVPGTGLSYSTESSKTKRKKNAPQMGQNDKSIEPMNNPSGKKQRKRMHILAWILTVFFLLASFAYIPHISGFLSLIITLILLPLDKWQQKIHRFLRGKFKTIVVVLLTFIVFCTAPVSTEADKKELSAEPTMEQGTDETTDTTTEQTEHYETSLPAVIPSSNPEKETIPCSTEPSSTETVQETESVLEVTEESRETEPILETTEPVRETESVPEISEDDSNLETVPETTVFETVPETTVPESVPETTEAEQQGLIIVSWPETISRNEMGTVTIQGKPNTEYYIYVYYKSGASSAEGLEPHITDGDGFTSWTWKVGGRTSLGTFRITVNGGGETVSVNFTVQQ